MNRVKTGIATFALAAAVVTPVALAGPASANPQNGLVNVNAENILNGNQITVLQNVSVPVAAALCNINANVLSAQLQNNQKGNCPALSKAGQIAWVTYN
jgi:hypothetical protein